MVLDMDSEELTESNSDMDNVININSKTLCIATENDDFLRLSISTPRRWIVPGGLTHGERAPITVSKRMDPGKGYGTFVRWWMYG